MPKPKTKALITFARGAIEILSANEEWSADETDAIAGLAIDLKLAKLDRNGYFKAALPPIEKEES